MITISATFACVIVSHLLITFLSNVKKVNYAKMGGDMLDKNLEKE